MNNSGAMSPAEILTAPTGEQFQEHMRRWQGIPSIDRSPGGQLYSAWYSGMETERGGNFVVVSTSGDEGDTWNDAAFIVVHPDPGVRCYDPAVWTDPLGRVWLVWAQSFGFFDGRCGVWVSLCGNPDAPEPTWSKPRRIANGIMMNKPAVTSSGEWVFPCAVWACHTPTESHPEVSAERFSNVYVTADQGETFELRGGADIPNRSFDEHMVVERTPGELWMLVRRFDGIGESLSVDGGRTWSPGTLSEIDGPCSLFHIRRLPSGRLLMVNHDGIEERLTKDQAAKQGDVKSWLGRSRITAFLSEDDGRSWPYKLLLDERDDISYPDAAYGPDGRIYVIYDRGRMTECEILFARVTEEEILSGVLSKPASVIKQPVSVAGALLVP